MYYFTHYFCTFLFYFIYFFILNVFFPRLHRLCCEKKTCLMLIIILIIFGLNPFQELFYLFNTSLDCWVKQTSLSCILFRLPHLLMRLGGGVRGGGETCPFHPHHIHDPLWAFNTNALSCLASRGDVEPAAEGKVQNKIKHKEKKAHNYGLI